MDAVEFVEERRRMFAVSAGEYSLFDMNTRAEDVVKADAVLRSLPNDLPYKGSVRRVLMQAATVDAAPIVWCKKCKFWAPGKSRRGFFEDCVLKQGCMPADGFCRYGVRKE